MNLISFDLKKNKWKHPSSRKISSWCLPNLSMFWTIANCNKWKCTHANGADDASDVFIR
jgi:hypothetical protein